METLRGDLSIGDRPRVRNVEVRLEETPARLSKSGRTGWRGEITLASNATFDFSEPICELHLEDGRTARIMVTGWHGLVLEFEGVSMLEPDLTFTESARVRRPFRQRRWTASRTPATD